MTFGSETQPFFAANRDITAAHSQPARVPEPFLFVIRCDSIILGGDTIDPNDGKTTADAVAARFTAVAAGTTLEMQPLISEEEDLSWLRIWTV